MDVDVALTYLDFVAERHRVYERRRAGEPGPWSADPLLRSYKFTNVYRVLDYGSQFLMTDLLEPDLDERDTLARCFLYRFTNLPETWQWVREQLGRYPVADDFNADLVRMLQDKKVFGGAYRIAYQHTYTNRVFSGAYVILPKPGHQGDKVVQAVDLAASLFTPSSPYYVVDDYLAATSQQERFDVLQRTYGVGKFLAMQILTDWGYSTHAGADREDLFVQPGPGCIKGAKFIDPSANPYDTLMWAVAAVRDMSDVPLLRLPDGRTRPPSWMDVQNTLCEFSKYHRFAAKPPRASTYVPNHPGAQPDPVLPAHW